MCLQDLVHLHPKQTQKLSQVGFSTTVVWTNKQTVDVDITITYIKHLIELLNYDVSDVLYAAVVQNLLTFQTLGLVCWLSLPLLTGVSQAFAGQVNPFIHVIIEHELIILHMLSDSIYEKAFQLLDDYSLILSFLPVCSQDFETH